MKLKEYANRISINIWDKENNKKFWKLYSNLVNKESYLIQDIKKLMESNSKK